MGNKLLKIEGVIGCKILHRLNRFVVTVLVNGECSKAYINNTGRLRDYLVK